MWQQIHDELVFYLHASSEDIRARISEIRDESPELAELLEALCNADRGKQPIETGFGMTADRNLADTKVGPYILTELLGMGGMGVVYKGYREDNSHQVVAVKLLNYLSQNKDAARRFQKEQRLLARLDHPNVARFLDAGSDAGRPWFAMEYVKGDPLDDYCNKGNLGLPERLQLFVKVCEAVGYAHRRLILHRDLKPANIVVDARGEPKLLDFGLAGLLQEETGYQQTLTAFVKNMMTLRYASPEQIGGLELDASSDVYSLGVILYELLAEHSPYGDLEGKSTAWLLDRILNHDHIPLHGSRSIKMESLTRKRHFHIPLDLSAILAKALAREPRERYHGPDELADDLRRYLEGRPVAAQKHSWRYVLVKTVRRHRLATAFGALFLVACSAFMITLIRLNHNLTRERAVATQERDTAEETSKFLAGIFDELRPERLEKSSVSLIEVLDRSLQRLEKTTSIKPHHKRKIKHIIARSYINLGNFDKAEQLIGESLEDRKEHVARWHVHALSNLSSILRRRDKKQALVIANEALDLAREIEPGHSALQVVAMLENARALASNDQTEEALEMTLAANTMLSMLPNNRPYDETISCTQICKYLLRLDRPEEAQQWLNKAIEITKEKRQVSDLMELYEDILTLSNDGGLSIVLDDDDILAAQEWLKQKFGMYGPAYVNLQLEVAIYRREHGRFAESNQILEDLLAGDRVMPLSQNSKANVYMALCNLRRQEDKFEDALTYARMAHRLRTAINNDDLAAAKSWNNLGNAYMELGNYEDGALCLRKALDIKLNFLDPTHSSVLTSQENLAIIFAMQKNFEAAGPLFHDVLAACLTKYPKPHRALGRAHGNLGHFYFDTNRNDKAIIHLEKSIAIYEILYGPDHNSLLDPLTISARVYRRLGQSEKVAEFRSRTFQIRLKNNGPCSKFTMRAGISLLDAQLSLNKHSEAKELLNQLFECDSAEFEKKLQAKQKEISRIMGP